MSSSTIRAFVGLRVPENLSAQMNDVSATLASQDRGQMSWVAEDNYHVTLLFLGEQTERWLEDLAELMDADIDLPVQKMRVSNIMPFPERSPKLLAAMLEPTEALSRLHQQIKLAAKKLGYVAEKRRFRPHITLARKFPSTGQLMIPSVEKSVEDTATELIIYESKLSASGAEYYPIFEFDLF